MTPPPADLTVKVTGNQWYWTYEYPDNGGFEIVSNMLRRRPTSSRASAPHRRRRPAAARRRQAHGRPGRRGGEGDHHLQRRDPRLGVPAFWVKMDAVPGRLNETWFRVDRPGVYYGVCYRIVRRPPRLHADRGRSGQPEQFAAWVASQGGTCPARKPAAARAGRRPGGRHDAARHPGSGRTSSRRRGAGHQPSRATR